MVEKGRSRLGDCKVGSLGDFRKFAKTPVKREFSAVLWGKANGGERNQTLAAVIANHPFTNAFVGASSGASPGSP
jgi:hypothetical protein